MKNIKKLLSIVTAIAIVAMIFAMIPVQVSAEGGDVFTINAVPDGWRFYTSSCVDRENSGAQFGVKANKGKGLDNYGVMLANGLSTEVVKADTTYRISFNIYTWYTIGALQADVDTGTALWSRTNKVTTFSNLADYVTASSGGGDVRYSYDVSLDVTTPSTITGNQHFVLGIITKDGSTTTTANLRFRNITITEAKDYNVIDASTGESIGTIGSFPGVNTESLITGSVYDKEGFSFTVEPEVLAADTENIVVTYAAKRELNVYDADTGALLGTLFAVDDDDCYELIENSPYKKEGFNFDVEPEVVEPDTEAIYVTYTEAPVQRIYFDKNYRGNPESASFASWQQLVTDSNGTLEIVDEKLRPRVWETGGVKMTAKTDFSNRAFVMANNYGKPGMAAGKTYRVKMVISIDTQYWTINDLNAQIKFGSNVWNDLTGNIILTGEDLADSVAYTVNNGTVRDYHLSMNIAIPADAKNNIVMSVYGFTTETNEQTGEETTAGVYYTIDDIEIWNTFDITVEDQYGEQLGTVKARIGDSVAKAAKDYLGEYGGNYYTASTETVRSLDEPIVLLKAAKSVHISFYADGGIGEMPAEEIEAGEYVLPQCVFTAPDGKAFKAWNVDGEEKQAGDTVPVDDDIEIIAVWGCAHTNTHVVETVASTCITAGHGEYVVCNDCGVIVSGDDTPLALDPNNHEGETEVRGAADATCTEAGYTGDTYCLGCGAKLAEGEVVEALGHDFGEYVSDGNATCTADGTKTAKCSRCDVTDTVDDVGSMLDHTVGEWIFDEVSHHRHCDMCDEDVDVGEHAYQWVVVTPATVDADGLKKEVCSICGYESGNTDVIPKLENHTPGDINGDGAVNNKDLTRLFQYLSDWDVEVNVAALDVNGDGNVNNKDLTRLFQYLSDWDVEIF